MQDPRSARRRSVVGGRAGSAANLLKVSCGIVELFRKLEILWHGEDFAIVRALSGRLCGFR